MKSPKILMLTALVCGGSLTTAGLAGAGDSAAGAETLPPPNSQVERDKGTEPPSEGLSDQQLLDIARSKADRHGLSVAEARQSILDSKEILDFKLANLEEPWFGSVWVTYSDGYQVHVRVTQPNKESTEATNRLSNALGRNVRVTAGGASAQALEKVQDLIRSRGLDVGYTVNDELGRLDVYNNASTVRSFAGTVPVHVVEPTVVYEPMAVSTGDSVRPQASGWDPNCVAGFLYEGSNFTGYGTAAHCGDGYTYVYGYYSVSGSTLRYTDCTNDIQMKDFATTATQTENMREPQTGDTWPIRGIAAGYYTGQDVIHVGRYTNAIRGSGEVIGWGPEPIGAKGGCPAENKGYLKTDVAGNPGDSGGPALLIYGSNLYLAGTLIGSGTQSSINTWLNFVGIPGNGHYCTTLNPC